MAWCLACYSWDVSLHTHPTGSLFAHRYQSMDRKLLFWLLVLGGHVSVEHAQISDERSLFLCIVEAESALINVLSSLSGLFCLCNRCLQTSCFCCSEINSGIKFNKSTAEARRLDQTFELTSARNWAPQALPCYTTLARQRFKRRASAAPNKIHKLISMYFGVIAFQGEVTRRITTWL